MKKSDTVVKSRGCGCLDRHQVAAAQSISAYDLEQKERDLKAKKPKIKKCKEK